MRARTHIFWMFFCFKELNMPIQKPTYQLMLKLDLPSVYDDASNSADARLRAAGAKKAIESLYGKIGAPKWLDEYLQLRDGGWPWRVSVWPRLVLVSRRRSSQTKPATRAELRVHTLPKLLRPRKEGARQAGRSVPPLNAKSSSLRQRAVPSACRRPTMRNTKLFPPFLNTYANGCRRV